MKTAFEYEAEIALLRADAARYRWLRDEAEASDWEFIGYQLPAQTDYHVDNLRLAWEEPHE